MEIHDPAQKSLPTQPNPHHGILGRLAISLVMGTCLGVAIYFWPNIVASYYRPRPPHPEMKTGGTATILIVAENFWKTRYAKAKGVDIVCESVGSTQGVNRMIEGAYAIAFTHAPATAEARERANKGGIELVHIPLMLCGVVPAYHLTELDGSKEPLKFTGQVLADIYLGKIQKWDDPALKAINPGVKLPAKKIEVIHREDPSGTTQIFTAYLASASPEWTQKVGPGADKVKWPVGSGEDRNQGVAVTVRKTDGSIGYVDRLYVSLADLTLDYGAVQNREGKFVRAEPANLTAAANAVLNEIPEDLTFDLANRPGAESYPIAGVIYAICPSVQSAERRKQTIDFLHWAVHDGQSDIGHNNFAPLPPGLVDRIDKRLGAIKAM